MYVDLGSLLVAGVIHNGRTRERQTQELIAAQKAELDKLREQIAPKPTAPYYSTEPEDERFVPAEVKAFRKLYARHPNWSGEMFDLFEFNPKTGTMRRTRTKREPKKTIWWQIKDLFYAALVTLALIAGVFLLMGLAIVAQGTVTR